MIAARPRRRGARRRRHLPARPPRRRERARAGGARRAERIRVRAARLADARAIARVMRAAIRGLAREAYSPARLRAWSSLPPLYHAWAMTAGGEAYVVAEGAGGVVGYAARRGGEVTAVFVAPRAARRGVGGALLARVERDARRRGVGRLVVRAARSAVAFYEAAGFAGDRPVAVPLPGGLTLPSRLLAKRLAPRRDAQRRPQGRRNGQRRHAPRSSRRGKASSRARLRAGSSSAARIAPMEVRISSRQRSSVAASAATETRSPAEPFSPTR